MKNVIRKIFSNEADEEVHSAFIKFSRGTFENRYLLECKKQKGKWAVKSSAEFANYFVRRCLGKSSGKVRIQGAIICTFSLEGKIKVEKIKQFAGVKQHLINTEISPKEVLDIMDKYPRAFYALSFSTGDCELKIKAKLPKSAKPGTSTKDAEGPKADFCSLKTSDFEIIEDLFFDVENFPDFNSIKIKHTLEIKDIEIPSGIKDPAEMREKSVRKGAIRRFVNVNGARKESEKSFAA